MIRMGCGDGNGAIVVAPSSSLIHTVRWQRGFDGGGAPTAGCFEGGRWGHSSGPIRGGAGGEGGGGGGLI